MALIKKNIISLKTPPIKPKLGDSDYRFLLPEQRDGIQWNLGGAYTYSPIVRTISENLITFFLSRHYCDEVSDAFPCLWNLEWYQQGYLPAPKEITNVLNLYAGLNISFDLIFDNPYLIEQDLKDIMGNSLLAYLEQSNRLNTCGVYVASNLLFDHVKSRYPKLKIFAAENYILMYKTRTAELYNELTQKFDRVALHPEDITNKELLAKIIEKDKIEITANNTCAPSCPARIDHLKLLNNMRREPFNVEHLSKRHQILRSVGCEAPASLTKYTMGMLSQHTIDQLFTQGFTHFRLQTATIRNEVTLLYQIERYLFTSKPELAHKLSTYIAALSGMNREKTDTLASALKQYRFKKYD